MTRILRDFVSREVDRALMREFVVILSSCKCLVRVSGVLSSTPRTRWVSEGPMEGMAEVCELMVTDCFCRRDARS
jgi:hypothetical protein